MNSAMKPLAYYAHNSIRQGNQIEVPIPYTIMGFEIPVFLSFDDIFEFINLQEISANCILVYMRYDVLSLTFLFMDILLYVRYNNNFDTLMQLFGGTM